MFIAGEPMNSATNILTGRSYSAQCVDLLQHAVIQYRDR
jgi:hypothetical protein